MAGRVQRVLHNGSSADPAVISLDTGGTTGWCVSAVDPAALTDPEVMIMDSLTHLSWGQFAGTEVSQVDQILSLVEFWPGAAVLAEQFTLRMFSADPALLSPVRINAAVSYQLRKESGATLWYQQPSLAKTTIDDTVLDYLGYLEQTRGKEHARDAMRHNFTFWRRLKTQGDLLRKVFPAVLDR